jgi:glycosyltransferase involved in cell wall biosynthesis
MTEVLEPNRSLRPLKIAFLGTRGIPANYGGFETFTEELSIRLASRGHKVTVYCRARNGSAGLRTFRGVDLVQLPAIRNKYMETFSHTLYSAMHALFRPFDIAYVCNSANAPICFIPWMRRQRTILNVDGLEWRRAKWSPLAKRYSRWATRLAARMPIEVVTDAKVIQDYYRTELNRTTHFFPYGTDQYERGYRADLVAAMGFEPGGYLLYVSRMEPENNALLTVQAYRKVETDIPLVMVGDAPYAQDYIRAVKAAADDRVHFLGYRFGDEYRALQANALAYIQATEVGGTHPALLEALGHGNAILVQDVPEHHEVVGEAGRYFAFRDAEDLARQMRFVLEHPDEVQRLRGVAQERAQNSYTWDALTDDYEAYFATLIDR